MNEGPAGKIFDCLLRTMQDAYCKKYAGKKRDANCHKLRAFQLKIK